MSSALNTQQQGISLERDEVQLEAWQIEIKDAAVPSKKIWLFEGKEQLYTAFPKL